MDRSGQHQQRRLTVLLKVGVTILSFLRSVCWMYHEGKPIEPLHTFVLGKEKKKKKEMHRHPMNHCYNGDFSQDADYFFYLLRKCIEYQLKLTLCSVLCNIYVSYK